MRAAVCHCIHTPRLFSLAFWTQIKKEPASNNSMSRLRLITRPDSYQSSSSSQTGRDREGGRDRETEQTTLNRSVLAFIHLSCCEFDSRSDLSWPVKSLSSSPRFISPAPSRRAIEASRLKIELASVSRSLVPRDPTTWTPSRLRWTVTPSWSAI